MKKEKTKIKQPMPLPKKILLFVLLAVLLVVACIALYIFIRFYCYNDYKSYLGSYVYEEGGEFTALNDSDPKVPGMELVTENEYLKLYADTDSGEVAVYDKRDGSITYSNPQDADEDMIANKTNKSYMKSQFIINYYNAARTMGTYDSYSMSVERGQLSCEGIENGIRFIYKVGDFSTNTTGIVPLYMTKEKLDEICSKLDETGVTNMNRYYLSTDEKTGMQVLNGVATKNIKTIQKITGYLETAGFTEEDYQEQMNLAGYEAAIPLSFVIALEYRLDGDSLIVSVPASAMKEEGGGSLYRIRLLGYFAAAGTDEEGYIVVPNGSGSLINFNNGKTNVENYSQYIYDIDPLASEYTQLENTEKVRLPFCAICREDRSVLMEVTEGATTAFFTASVSGSATSYNSVNTTFVLRGYDLLTMFGSTGNEAELPILEDEIYDVNYTVAYRFLNEDYRGYAGLANYYREKLVNEGVLTKKDSDGDIPLFYDIIGGVKKKKSIVGVKYLSTFSMTTFDEAGLIYQDLASKGVNNQIINYMGWSNDGYYPDVYDDINKLNKLGGKKDLEKLNETVSNGGGTLYVDVPFQKVTMISDDYWPSFETSRYYGAGYTAEFGSWNPATLRKTSSLGYDENIYYLLSPKFLPRYVKSFVKEIKKIDVAGISLRDLGDDLHSDKKRTEVINREEALDILIGQFELLDSTEKKLMVNGGNAYSFKYAQSIINAPTDDNEFRIIDEEIPLYEMIIHGCIDYCGSVLNYYDTYDKSQITLRLIEYGAAPHYMFTWENASEMKLTALNRFYATKYENWSGDAVSMYETVNEVLKNVSGSYIIDHEILSPGVKKVTYDNGTVIYLNYNDTDAVADGITIPAKSYEMEGVR